MIPKEVIKGRAASQTELRLGRALSEQGAVTALGKAQFWKGEQEIWAKVQEGGMTYQTALLFKQGKLYEHSCSCRKDLSGLCRHQVAALLEEAKQEEKISPRKLFTSPAARDMLRQYEEERTVRLLTQGAEEPVTLQPVFGLEGDRASVRFRVGNRKAYIIKDLLEFGRAFLSSELVSYGKNLSFYHREDAFAEESRPVLSFLLEQISQWQEAKRQFSSGRRRVLSELPLTEGAMDRFFSLYTGKSLLVVDRYGVETGMPVEQADPLLSVTVSGKQGNGYRFSLQEGLRFWHGRKHLYVQEGGRIRICSEEYTKDLGPFFEAMEADGLSDQRGIISIGESELPLFCCRVLPALEKRMHVTGECPDSSRYQQLPLCNQFYFDREDGRVLLRILQSYGAEQFSPLQEACPAYVHRDYAMEEVVSRLVTRYFRYRDPEQDSFVVPEEEEQLFLLLTEGLPRFRELGEVYLSESFRQVPVRQVGRARAGISVSGNWLELSVEAEGLDPEEVSRMLSAYRRRKRYVRLKDGSFGTFDPNNLLFLDRLQQGLGLSDKELSDPILLSGPSAWYVDWLLESMPDMQVSGREALAALLDRFSGKQEVPLPEGLRGELRTYQKEGYQWLYRLTESGFGGLLADEMGLGKTVQIIALLCKKKEEGKQEVPSLVVCPASLVYNWEQEIRRFAPSLSVLPVVGGQEERQALLEQSADYDVLVTSYELLKRDRELYRQLSFSCQIIDEAQYIKNAATQNARAVKQIRAAHRFALTGTPMENRLSELWSIFDYLLPGHLKSYGSFRERFEGPIVKNREKEAALRLQKLIAPFFLRRLKREVLRDLPPRLETVVYAGLSGEQKSLYQAHAAMLQKEIAQGGFAGKTVQLLAGLTRLRQLCCDPRLYYENYGGESAKLDTCMELVKSGLSGGHKILLFSQFTSMLALIRERLSEAGISWFLLTGETSKEERAELVKRFQRGEAEVFLISLKAGGTGLNLTAADMVILYDPWWNVAAQDQAADRAHRIGQENLVSVFKLILRHTIEENILTLQEAKEALSDQIIGTDGWSVGDLSREELLHLLDGSTD